MAREAAKNAKGKREIRDRGRIKDVEWRLRFLNWIHGENSWFREIELGWKLDHQRSFKTSRPSRLRVIPGSEILARKAAKNAKGKWEIAMES